MASESNASPPAVNGSGSGLPEADGAAFRAEPQTGCRRLAIFVAVAMSAVTAGGLALVFRATRPVDTTPPEADLFETEPDRPLLAEDEQQVTFVLQDGQGNIPTMFLFEGHEQKTTALAINTLRGTPNDRGVEIRFEAVRFRRDEQDPDQLWARAVGIANETDGKTPLSLSALERGEPLEFCFRDEIQVPFVLHVIYEINMTIQYVARTQRLRLTDVSGSIRWKMLGSDAFEVGELAGVLEGRKGEYAEKPLLKL